MSTPRYVRIKHPTGGVRRDDRFRVVDAPEGKDPRWTWVVFDGPPDPLRRFTQTGRPLGFDESSLEDEPPDVDQMEVDSLNVTERVRTVQGHGVNE